MNILAFGQFQYKNPEMQDISNTVVMFQVKTNRTEHIIIASVEEKPSIPSMKL